MTNESFDMKEIQEQYEDAALTLLVNHIMQKEGEQFIAKNEELHEDPGFSYPADLDARMARTIDRHFTSLRRRKAFTAFKKTVSRVSMVFLVVFLIFSITFVNVSAFRDATLNLIEKTFSHGTVIAGPSSGIMNSISSKTPRWMPEGQWKLEFYSNNPNTVVTRYTRSDGSFINISRFDPSFVLSVDTEDAEIRRDITVNGNSSVVSIKPDSIMITWVEDQDDSIYGITIYGASDLISTEIIVRIAENLS